MAFKSGTDRIQTLGELLEQVDGPRAAGHRDQEPVGMAMRRWSAAPSRWLAAIRAPSPSCPSTPSRSRDCARRLHLRSSRGHRRRPDDPCLTIAILARVERLSSCASSRIIANDTQPDFISYHWRDLPFPPVTRFRADRAAGDLLDDPQPAEAASSACAIRDQITFEGFARELAARHEDRDRLQHACRIARRGLGSLAPILQASPITPSSRTIFCLALEKSGSATRQDRLARTAPGPCG